MPTELRECNERLEKEVERLAAFRYFLSRR
jgi:hypothetical protein